jgi:hypothetical protein
MHMKLLVCGLTAVVLAGLGVLGCSDNETSGTGGSGNTGNTGAFGGTGGSGNSGNTGNTGNTGGGGSGNTGGSGGSPQPGCGNGIREGTELCDGADFGGQTCQDFGLYPQGALWCAADCSIVDETGCYTAGTTCGDGTADGIFEPCDGDPGMDCQGMGYTGGTLGCGANCQLDVSGCQGDLCTAMMFYDDGTCDPCELLGGTADGDCQKCGADGECVSYIFDGMVASMSTCVYETGVEDPDCGTCGDDIKNPTERCDGQDLGNPARTCADLGYAGGTLACDSHCHLDPAGCT